MTDEGSDMVEIKKGTKQGDPLSSLVFNRVLQKAVEENISHWQKKEELENMPERQRSFQKCCANSRKVLKSGTRSTSRKDENPQQQKLEHWGRN